VLTPRIRYVSLRLRLALWYGGLTGVVSILVCLYAYAIHSRAQYDQLDATLRVSAQHIAAELATSRTPRERAEKLAASVLLGAASGVYGANGDLLQTGGGPTPTLDAAKVLSAGYEPSYPAIAVLAPRLYQVPTEGSYSLLRDGRGERWRLHVRPVPGSDLYLATTFPLAPLDGAVASFARLMFLITVLGSSAAFAAGWLLARRALRPVAALTQTVTAIAQSRSFSRRVSDGGDTDELGWLATTFNAMLASLEEAFEGQQRFIAAASHELRAPLTVVQANLELLRTRWRGMTEAERGLALGEAHAEAMRMNRLVADLLVLARADAGVLLHRQPVELDRVLLDVMAEARHIALGKRLEIAAIEPVIVQGDPDRLKQLLLILIDNALNYTGEGGHVSVSLRRVEESVFVDISDTGVGIAAEDLPRVFERFYRVDPARSRHSGTGLGLPIARWIAEGHGGMVALVSAAGIGTTATIRLPAEG
jgi:two-component system OmpR family sensor kinase